MFTVAFWKAAAERAAKTAAQAVIGVLVQDGVDSINLFDANVENVIGFAAGGAVLSVLFSIVSVPLSAGSSPSLVPAAEVEAAKS